MSGSPPRPDAPEPSPDGATSPRARSAASGSAPVDLSAGRSGTAPLFDAYRIVRKLGEGGMGAVYLAEDRRLGRAVAIKTMRRDLAANALDRARFEREARAAARVEHDNIVPILHVGEESDGAPYIVMPFLKGEPLDARLKREPVPPLELVLKVAREVADGLAAAHAKGLIHRDIKPANIWLEAGTGPDGPVHRCRVLDFGLARSADALDPQLTASGAILGTPAYMAPEQARGGTVDHRADLWGLGVTLYRMATGRPPFAGETVLALFAALATDEPQPVRDLAPHIPLELARLIEALLHKSPSERPQSAAEVAEAVRRIEAERARPLDIPDEDTDADDDVPAQRRPRGRRAPLIIAAVFLVACAGVGIFALTRPGRPEREQPEDDRTAQAARPGPKAPEKGTGGEPDTKLPPPPKEEKPNPVPPPKIDPPDTPQGPKWLPGDPAVPAGGPKQKYPVQPPTTGWPPKELVTLHGDERFRHWGPVNALAGSADGKWLVTVTQRPGTVGFPRYVLHLWDAATGKEAATAEEHGYCSVLAFAPDSRRLAVNTGTVTLWEFDGQKLRKGATVKPFAALGEREIPGPSSNTNFFRVSIAPVGDTLVATGVAGTVWRWTLDGVEATPNDVFPRLPGNSRTFGVSADGESLTWAEHLSTTRKTRIWVRRRSDPKAVEVADSINEVSDLSLSNDGRVLAAVAGAQLRVWDLSGAAPRERPAQTPAVSNPRVWSFSPDGRFLVVGSLMGAARYVDLRDANPAVKELTGVTIDPSPGNPVAWLGSDQMVTRANDGTVRVWRWKGSAFEPRDDWYAGHVGPVCALAFGTDGTLASAAQRSDPHDRDRNRNRAAEPALLTVWSQKPGARPVTAALERGWFNGLGFSADGTVVACGSEQEAGKAAYQRRGFVRRYRADTGAVIDTVPNAHEIVGAAFDSDARTVAAVTGPQHERVVQLYQTNPPKPRGAPIKTQGLQAVALTGDGTVLATANENPNREGGVVRLWDLGAGAPQERAEPLAFGQKMKAEMLSFAPDGKRLASPALGLVYVWDVAARRERTGTREGYGASTTALAWTPDGKFVATATSDGRVTLYPADAPEKKVHEWRFPGPASALAFDRSGTRLATGNANGTVTVLDVEPLFRTRK